MGIKRIKDISQAASQTNSHRYFLNIFNNAKDALISNTKEEERRIYIEYKENASYHIIIVQDNAGGIPDNIMEKIFDPYFTTKHQAQGTGIGLYMSRSIVEDCGGKNICGK